MTTQLNYLKSKWSEKAKKYYDLAKREKDELGKKYYTAYATAFSNCIKDLKMLD